MERSDGDHRFESCRAHAFMFDVDDIVRIRPDKWHGSSDHPAREKLGRVFNNANYSGPFRLYMVVFGALGVGNTYTFTQDELELVLPGI